METESVVLLFICTCCGLVHEVGLSGRGTEDFGKPLDLQYFTTKI